MNDIERKAIQAGYRAADAMFKVAAGTPMQEFWREERDKIQAALHPTPPPLPDADANTPIRDDAA